MPTIACPGCGKKYNVPATAAGQVAKCGCGKRFKLAGAPSPSSAAGSPSASTPQAARANAAAVAAKPKSAPAAKQRSAPAAVATSTKANDDFWDEALREEVSARPVETKPASASARLKAATPAVPRGTPTRPAEAAPKKKRKKKSIGIRWGFDWGKVAAGLAAFVVFGGLTAALVMSSGRVSRGTMYLAVPAIAGLFTAINGLMGEEGIW